LPATHPAIRRITQLHYRRFAGGSHVVVANDPPFLYGPTFTGLRNLSQVDPALRRDGFKP